MSALRLAWSVALAVWLGGAITIAAIVAQSAFGVLGPADAATLVGETLRRFHLVTYAAALVMAAALGGMALIGPRPRAFSARMAVVGVMLVASLASGLWIDRRIARLRAEIGVPVATLAREDARRAAFGRLHGYSTALLGLTVIGGLVLLSWDARDSRS
jgi:uncharacterized membrane protein